MATGRPLRRYNVTQSFEFFAPCPKGIEGLLKSELEALQVSEVRETVAGCSFAGSLQDGYRVCMWSRLATQVLLQIAGFGCDSVDALFAGARRLAWWDHLGVETTFSISYSGNLDGVRNTQFGAQRVKDGLVDACRERFGARPNVERTNPDLRISARVHRGWGTLSLNLAGESLHRRGYRIFSGVAPLKENLAAALLIRAGWPDACEPCLVDPMCGSGTLLIEGAMMALDRAPGLLRQRWGFSAWRGHDAQAWAEVQGQAKARADDSQGQRSFEFHGWDADEKVIAGAKRNADAAKLGSAINFEVGDLATRTWAGIGPGGLLLTNPPYGERIGDAAALAPLYEALGATVRELSGWRCGVFTSNPELGHSMRVRSTKQYRLWNGALAARLLLFANPTNTGPVAAAPNSEPGATPGANPVANPVATPDANSGANPDANSGANPDATPSADPSADPSPNRAPATSSDAPTSVSVAPSLSAAEPKPMVATDLAPDSAAPTHGHEALTGPRFGAGGQMFANRLRKRERQLRSWRAKNGIECYRLYDADLPEYAVAIDRYGDWVHVAEYRAPSSIDPALAKQRLTDVVLSIPSALGVPSDKVILKERQRQRGSSQYERRDRTDAFIPVREGPARLLVNLRDYLDTGLFLDHRPLRLKLAELTPGKRFLNLFCYTASATVHAALAGASASTSVDLSKTYLDWAQRNFELNNIDGRRHRLVNEDCMSWLAGTTETFDIIMLDPPTFSNSKSTEATLDVQRDHDPLIRAAAKHLAPGGVLIFSTNRRRFVLDEGLSSAFDIEDVTRWSI
ncbi:MAG: 23S rRNA (guanine2445-N2)-methyltransferase / 23S rRNA (guanine2069-N7)-methyltransferase, partial [Gammaproteobacteria bacterium]